VGDPGSHLTHGCLGPPKSISQTNASRFVQPFLHSIRRTQGHVTLRHRSINLSTTGSKQLLTSVAISRNLALGMRFNTVMGCAVAPALCYRRLGLSTENCRFRLLLPHGVDTTQRIAKHLSQMIESAIPTAVPNLGKTCPGGL